MGQDRSKQRGMTPVVCTELVTDVCHLQSITSIICVLQLIRKATRIIRERRGQEVKEEREWVQGHLWLCPFFFMVSLARVTQWGPATTDNSWRCPAKDQRQMWHSLLPKMPPHLRQEMHLCTGMQSRRSRSLADGAALELCLVKLQHWPETGVIRGSGERRRGSHIAPASQSHTPC